MIPSNYPQLAVLIPCYNSGKAVLDVVQSCKQFTPNILLVNDGSDDETSDIITQCGCKSIGWKHNRGKGNALREGFKHWLHKDGWEYLITLDSDGQHDPALIPALVEWCQQSKAHIVLGTRRFERRDMPGSRYWANTMSSKLIAWMTGCRVRDFQCGYRLYTRHALEKLVPLLTSNAYSIETEMVLSAHHLGLPFAEVEMEAIYLDSASQRSSWRPLTDSYGIACVVAKHLLQRKPEPKNSDK